MKLFLKIMKILLIIIVVIASISFLFIRFYKPFGQGISAQDKNDYAQRTDAFYDGYFHGKPEISIMNDKESQFDGKNTTSSGKIPVNKIQSIPSASKDELKFIWFGHSSSMLQMDKKNILIDPVFSDYASPVAGFGVKRFSELPILSEDLPLIDIVIISHDHYDHLDYSTIKAIDKGVSYYCVPLGVENHLTRWGVDEDKIYTFAWWEEVEFGDLKITSVPGRHYSGRLPWQMNTSLWSGFVFESTKHTAYYTGDTGYGDHFKEIYEKFGDIDLMILENGQYDDSWEAIHMLPPQGIQACKDVNASWIIPVHWATFSLGYHPWDDPIKQITKLASEEGLNIATPLIGDIVNYSNINDFSQQWWEDVE